MVTTEDGIAAALHGVGLVLAAVLGAGLRRRSDRVGTRGDEQLVVVAFVAAWLALYATSVGFHLTPEGPVRSVLSVLDNSAIFVVIAAGWAPIGPFRLEPRRSRWLLAFLGATLAAGLAVEPTAVAMGWRDGFERVAYLLYAAQVTAPVVLLGGTILGRLSRASLAYLLGSIAAYAVGLIFYHRPDLRWGHAIWHGCVVVGCFINFGGVQRLLFEAGSLRSHRDGAMAGGGAAR